MKLVFFSVTHPHTHEYPPSGYAIHAPGKHLFTLLLLCVNWETDGECFAFVAWNERRRERPIVDCKLRIYWEIMLYNFCYPSRKKEEGEYWKFNKEQKNVRHTTAGSLFIDIAACETRQSKRKYCTRLETNEIVKVKRSKLESRKCIYTLGIGSLVVECIFDCVPHRHLPRRTRRKFT